MTMYLVYYWTTLIAMLILYKGIHHAAKNLEKKAKAKEHRHIALLLTQRLGTQVGVALTLHNQRQQELKNEVKDSGYHTNNHGTSDTVELSVPESKRESLLSTGKRESLTTGTSPARRNIHRKHSQQIIGNRYPSSPIAHRKRSSVKSIKTVPLREEDEDVLRSMTPDHDRRFQDSGVYDFTTADSLSSIFYDSSFSSVLQLKDLPSRPTMAEAADDNATLLQHAPSKKHRRPSSRKMSRNRKQSFTSATDSFSRAFCEDGQDIVVVHSENTHHHHRQASHPAQRSSWWKSPRQKIAAWFDRLRTPSSRKSSRAHERVTSRTSSISSSEGSSFASPEHELHDARPEVRIIREESTNLSGHSAVSPSQGTSFLSPTSGSARRLSWHGDIGAFTRNATEQVLSSLFKPISVVQGLTGRNRKQTKAERRAHKAFRTITFIVGLFAILWSPYYIVATVYGFCKGECIPAFLYNLSYYMCYLNSSGNPFAYALANRQFRMAFLKMFKGNFKRSA
ncbi:G protein linked acetylcholine receptor isoform a [Aphelenchoides avenae]|nr:G protein linked acetylcholine receptor isoform a [Aphelenchus avenae]